jgi:hypothetical protein
MKSTIGVYNSHKEAIEAINELVDDGYPAAQLSLIGKADLIDDHLHVRSHELLKEAPVSIGIVAGTVLGVLAGAGIVAIPGLGFILGAGAVIGGFAGFDLGLVGGGIVSILASVGIKKEHAVKYHEHLKVNRFLVIAQGSETEVSEAKSILEAHGKHVELNCH